MPAILPALLLCAVLQDVKAEMVSRYPKDAAQIQMVGLPSVRYKNHLWLNLKAMRFQAGRCDLFGKPQIIVVRDKRPLVTARRLKHEIEHYVVAAAGLPDAEHEAIDR
jgi:hypothetical protein